MLIPGPIQMRQRRSGGGIAMPESVMFHEGNRRLQDRFDSRRISDRLEEKVTRKEFNADDRTFIEGLRFFSLLPTDHQGRPASPLKGGPPGFLGVTGPRRLHSRIMTG